jgi:hypothetical protein
MANAPKRPAPQVFEHKPQSTVPKALAAAAAHVNAVHQAAQQKGK